MATPEDVQKLAALARIEVPEAELASFTKEFDAVLAYVGKLDELTLAHETPTAGVVRNVFREDGEPHEGGKYTQALVEQFPDKDGNHLLVKKILTHE
ncbi:MAG: Asp-tRNA(Asn)/Glu-tRNA(Gln) amidotransferase subunit GatC [Patescibacteria group bacterium]